MRYLTSASEWKTIADTLKDILMECYFVFAADKITMNNVDPEKVVEIYFEMIPKKETYFCPTNVYFPIYIQTIYRVLRGVKNNDMLEMSDLNDGSLKMYVYSNSGVLKNQITMAPLTDYFPVMIRNPRVYEIGVTFNNDQFYHILHDLGAISRRVSIHVKDSNIEFYSKDESGTSSTFQQHFQEIEPSYKFKNTFLLKFLEKYTKPGLQKLVTLRIDNNLPLSVVYYLENGSLELTIAGLE